MGKRIEKIRQWISDEPAELETQQTSIDKAIGGAISRLYRSVVPILMIALAIDLIIMFTVPVEVTMSQWFWLKSPLSIFVAYLIGKLFKSHCRHPA